MRAAVESLTDTQLFRRNDGIVCDDPIFPVAHLHTTHTYFSHLLPAPSHRIEEYYHHFP